MRFATVPRRGAVLLPVPALMLTAVLAGCTGDVDGRPVTPGGGAQLASANELAGLASQRIAEEQSARLDLQLDVAGMRVDGAGSYRLGPSGLAAAFDLTTPIGPVEFTVVDNALYFKVAEEIRVLFGVTTPWVEYNRGTEGADSTTVTTLFDSIAMYADVANQLMMAEEAGRVTKSAPDRVGRTETTCYWIDIDVATLVEQAGDPVVIAVLDALRAQGVVTVSQQLWLDGSGLPMKVVNRFAAAGRPVGELTIEYSGWGEPVDITPPPPDQISTPNLQPPTTPTR